MCHLMFGILVITVSRSSVSSHSEPHRGAKTGPEPPKKSGGRRNMAKIHAKMSAKAKKRRKRRCNRQKRLKPTRLSYVHSCASRRAQTFCKWLFRQLVQRYRGLPPALPQGRTSSRPQCGQPKRAIRSRPTFDNRSSSGAAIRAFKNAPIREDGLAGVITGKESGITFCFGLLPN